ATWGRQGRQAGAAPVGRGRREVDRGLAAGLALGRAAGLDYPRAALVAHSYPSPHARYRAASDEIGKCREPQTKSEMDRQPVFLGEIGEACHAGLELQLNGSGRSGALLADDDLGLAVYRVHFGLPLEVLFRAGARLLVLEIIFLAEQEQHDVGVLLDRAGFAQVRELRALVIPVLDLARELREREDRHLELLGERLETCGDLGHLLHAALGGASRRALQELQIVDHQAIEAALALQASRARGELRDRETTGLVDVERQLLHRAREGDNLVEISLGDLTAAYDGGGDFRLLGDDPGRELLGGHFEREETHSPAVRGLDRAVGDRSRLARAC